MDFVEDVRNTASLLNLLLLLPQDRMLLALGLRRSLLLFLDACILLLVNVLRRVIHLLIHVVIVQIQIGVRTCCGLVLAEKGQVFLEPPLLLLCTLYLLLNL